MKITAIPQLARNINRASEVLTILSKYGLADWVSRLNVRLVKGIYRRAVSARLAELTSNARIRLALTELGPTFIKFGQVLSTRPDLVGLPLATELTKLQAHLPADPPEVVRAMVKTELGKSVDELFATFDDVPLASASIGQVHAATLFDGTQVVLKIQHPNIVQRIRNDLEILTGLSELAEKYIEELRPYQPRAIVREFERTLTRELDFAREMRSLERFNKNFANDPIARFPEPYPNLCTNKILTMDRLDGIPVAEVSRVPPGTDLVELARQGARVWLEMIFRDGFYHADPHPGNLLIMPDGKIGLLDVGMIGQMTPALREDMEDLLLAIANNSTEQLVATLTRLCGASTIADPDALAADVADLLGYYYGVPLNNLDISRALNEVVEIIRRHHLILPTGIALLLRVLVVLEGTSRLLHPDFRLAEVIEPYREKMMMQRLSPMRQIRRIWMAARDWQDLAARLPNHVREVMQKIQNGRIEVQLQHHHLGPVANRLVQGMVTSALLISSSHLWAEKAPPTVYGISVIGFIGMIASMTLGALLLRAIFRSSFFDG
jgi:ubiquinone biosynthesis protein